MNSKLSKLRDLIEIAYNKASGANSDEGRTYPEMTLKEALALVNELTDANADSIESDSPEQNIRSNQVTSENEIIENLRLILYSHVQRLTGEGDRGIDEDLIEDAARDIATQIRAGNVQGLTMNSVQPTESPSVNLRRAMSGKEERARDWVVSKLESLSKELDPKSPMLHLVQSLITEVRVGTAGLNVTPSDYTQMDHSESGTDDSFVDLKATMYRQELGWPTKQEWMAHHTDGLMAYEVGYVIEEAYSEGWHEAEILLKSKYRLEIPVPQTESSSDEDSVMARARKANPEMFYASPAKREGYKLGWLDRATKNKSDEGCDE